MKKSDVLSRLKRMVAWNDVPSLTDEDMDYLVSVARVRDVNGHPIEDVEEWEPFTSYEIGDVAVVDGQRFICVVAGVSGTTAPTPSMLNDAYVTWATDGTSSWTPTYDLNRGAYEGWKLKAAKAATMISFTADGARFDRDQYIANCEYMQRKYAQQQSLVIRKRYHKYIVGVPRYVYLDD